jgi:predicted acylesterase/phospholipase RssA
MSEQPRSFANASHHGPASSRGVTAVLVALLLVVSGCTQKLVRNALPVSLTEEAQPLGLENMRTWGDHVTQEQVDQILTNRVAFMKQRFAKEFATGITPRLYFLALSGGGQHGAFGAGVLRAWSESGTRPVFDGVSGVSTGAIIAPFAYLGSDYDDVLEEFYTTHSTEDLLIPTIFSGITGGTALSSTSPLRDKIAQYITPEILERVASEHRNGRLLFVGTTNLDVSRPVIWNMGAIAGSGHPDALQLFRDVILASAAIPVAFPPVFINVEAGGATYDEMHVDGGATSQVSLVSPEMPIYRADEQLGHKVDREVFVIVNGRIVPSPKSVSPRVLKIGAAALSSLTYSGTISDLYKIYAITERDQMDVRFGWTPETFIEEPTEAFDSAYMRKLYDYGHDLEASGKLWSNYPPYFAARDNPASAVAQDNIIAQASN